MKEVIKLLSEERDYWRKQCKRAEAREFNYLKQIEELKGEIKKLTDANP